ncbi:MAG TPA: class I tRNA ligase family protein, partial [Candidatus Saccharimonadales bacterium]|nr:class I tRNA ligase family protein [Candidatus Saccharimonadales bacterium]
EKGTYILAWSTTPWNKIVTPALAVNPELMYIKVEQDGEKYILAKPTIKVLGEKNSYKIIEEFQGSTLVGKKYIPHYDYYKSKITKDEKAFVVIPGDFVTADEGTGVVTIAVYGEEDLKAMQENNIHIEMHVDEEGTIKPDVPLFGGMYYLKANKAVNEDLAKRNLIYKDEEQLHNVPLCWRCHTRLYYAPQNAWYVNVQKLKDKLKATNENVNWVPAHFKYGRYLKSLENAPDWCISRSRYWGSPIPVWECEEGHRTVPGSIKELEELSNQKITDLHKPGIDEVIVKCKECGKDAKRTPEVLDSWIEAGSAPYAERHFPFEKGLDVNKFFPPDFITEYTGQIRAWFFILHIIGTALFATEAFKNVLVTGVIQGTDGRKMSKNYHNYPDPKELLQKYGGDALRLYLMGSPVINGEDIIISEEQYRNQVRGLLLIYWNVYNFFITNANIDNWSPSTDNRQLTTVNVLDRWILSRLAVNVTQMSYAYENFLPMDVVVHMQEFMNDLSLWYIRRTRDRVGPAAKDQSDKESAHQTMYKVLTTFTQVLSPLIPFITEEIYTNLTDEISVHLTNFPKPNNGAVDENLEKQMMLAQEIVSTAHAIRKEKNLKVRQPLASLTYGGEKLDEEIEKIIADEVNVKAVQFKKGAKVTLDEKITPQLKAEGEARDIIRQIQQARKEANCKLDEKIEVQLPQWPKEYEEKIKAETLTAKLTKGDSLEVKRKSGN